MIPLRVKRCGLVTAIAGCLGGANGAGADGGAPGGNGGDEGAICRSGSELDVFDGAGTVDPARYRALAAAFATAPSVGDRFGQSAEPYGTASALFVSSKNVP